MTERRERRELKEERWVIDGLWVGFALLRDLDPARYKRADLASRHHRLSACGTGGSGRAEARTLPANL
jgi:hypothetical protein